MQIDLPVYIVVTRYELHNYTLLAQNVYSRIRVSRYSSQSHLSFIFTSSSDCIMAIIIPCLLRLILQSWF